MLKYTEELYAKFGRKHIPTGKTGAQWDEMDARNKALETALAQAIDCYESGDTEGIMKALGVVRRDE